MNAMRAPVQLPVVQGTAEWLAMRRAGIGSSDAPVIAGERGSVIELWAEKAGLVEPAAPDGPTQVLFDWGHRLEPVVAEWYSDTTGRPLRRVNRMLRHPEIEWAFASLDRVTTKGDKRIVEIKTTRWGWDDDEVLPGAIQAQVQHQLWVAGYDVADIAVLIGGSEPRIIEIPRDDAFIDDLRFLETEFWGWVTSKTRPPVDGSETARRVLSALHPRSDGTLIPSDPETDALVYRLRDARAAARATSDEASTLENTLRALIGDADGIEGEWGKATLKNNSVKDWTAIAAECDPPADLVAMHTTTNWKAVAEALRVRPEVIERHTARGEGPRVIRLPKGW